NCRSIPNKFPEGSLDGGEATTDQDRKTLGGLGAAGLKDVLVVDRLSPITVGDATEQEVGNDPAFGDFKCPCRDVATVTHTEPPFVPIYGMKPMASVGFRAGVADSIRQNCGCKLLTASIFMQRMTRRRAIGNVSESW